MRRARVPSCKLRRACCTARGPARRDGYPVATGRRPVNSRRMQGRVASGAFPAPERQRPDRVGGALRIFRDYRRPSAQRVHAGVQDAGPQVEAPLHPRHHGPVPPRVDSADPGRRHGQRPEVHRGESGRGAAEPDQHLLRWSSASAECVRAGHHALHHGVDHHPAAARGDPALRGALQGGAVGHRQAHRVHALPHDRPGRPPVRDHRGHGRQRQTLPELQRIRRPQ